MKIKTAQHNPVGILAESLVSGQKSLRENIDGWEFPVKVTQEVEYETHTMVHEYELRLSKKKTLSLHHMGVTAKKYRQIGGMQREN